MDKWRMSKQQFLINNLKLDEGNRKQHIFEN
jgi:hypothetical protein